MWKAGVPGPVGTTSLQFSEDVCSFLGLFPCSIIPGPSKESYKESSVCQFSFEGPGTMEQWNNT
jgi:hypothetical protein